METTKGSESYGMVWYSKEKYKKKKKKFKLHLENGKFAKEILRNTEVNELVSFNHYQ